MWWGSSDCGSRLSWEAAIHAEWSQLPLIYGLIPALLQPVIQGKLLSLVVKQSESILCQL